jgi:serine/threonine-protein kinase
MAAEQPRTFGRYLLLERLGKGGMGSVYLARGKDLIAGRPAEVALKIMNADQLGDTRARERFVHEATVAQRLRSEHVARVFEAGLVDELPYIVSEYIPGWTVRELIDRLKTSGTSLPLAAALDLFRGALLGLEDVHAATDEQGRSLELIHRDVSPRNLLFDVEGRIKLIDFGIGRSVLKDWRTATGTALGTSRYGAPEQISGRGSDARSDQFGFGAVFYEALTLAPIRDPRDPSSFAEPKIPPPSELRSGLPAGLDAALMRSLAHAPEDRFASIAELRRALEALLPAGKIAGRANKVIAVLFEEELEAIRAEANLPTRAASTQRKPPAARPSLPASDPEPPISAAPSAASISVRSERARRPSAGWLALALFAIAGGALGVRFAGEEGTTDPPLPPPVPTAIAPTTAPKAPEDPIAPPSAA